MLVKGASSYNALKRAIKQDLVEAGQAGRGNPQDPNVLYEVGLLVEGWPPSWEGMDKTHEGGRRARAGRPESREGEGHASGSTLLLQEGRFCLVASTGPDPAHKCVARLQIDRLAMERVAVFPDGDINIQGLASSPHSAAFSRPVSQCES